MKLDVLTTCSLHGPDDDDDDVLMIACNRRVPVLSVNTPSCMKCEPGAQVGPGHLVWSDL